MNVFNYHNVGQGLFHSGKVHSSDFVYDCGADSTHQADLTNAIKYYKSSIWTKNKLDLLIISHLHYDHVSGLDLLLNARQLGTVVLPYIRPIERLLMAVYSTPSSAGNWFYSFLADPVLYFLERGADKIILIEGEEGEPGEFPIAPDPSNDSPSEIVAENLGKLNTKRNKRDEEHFTDQVLNGFNSGQVVIRNHTGFLTLSNLWIFRFFNFKVPMKKINAFKAALRIACIDPTDQKSIRSSIVNNNAINLLQSCYKHLQKDLNKTSLIVYHGPLLPIYDRLHIDCYNSHRESFQCLHIEPPGQILTGDASFNYTQKHMQMINHFTNYLAKVSVFQIPHHGSRHNWKRQLLNHFPKADVWIAPHGIRNKYKHPSDSVIMDILNEDRIYLPNNERNRIEINIPI